MGRLETSLVKGCLVKAAVTGARATGGRRSRLAMRYLPLLLLPITGLAQESKPLKEAAPSATEAPAVATPASNPKPKVDPYPSLEQVEAALKKALGFTRANLSFAGGYATKWSRDVKESRTSDTKSPSLISIEAPGTPVLGSQFLRAWRVTGDPLFLQGAREAAQALLWTQLASGGWGTIHDYALPVARKQHYRRDLAAGDLERGERRAHTTLDDDKTQYALTFLLEFSQVAESGMQEQVKAAVAFGLDALLAAQMTNGGWPQGFDGPADASQAVKPVEMPVEWPRKHPQLDYTPYATLNDGNLVSVCDLLLKAHEITGEERYLTAVKKLGDFLLLAQCPEPQRGWAQQYDADMRPAWARKFEPPCVSSLESVGALNVLHTIWLATGEDRYRAPFESALAWLESVRLPDGQYARFYELHTDKPLYFVKDTYELTYDDSNLPTHYGFKIDDLQEDIDKFKKRCDESREALLARRKPIESPKEWLSEVKDLSNKLGTALRDQNKEGVWTRDNVIEADLIVRHTQAMILYLEAAKGAGSLFEAFREKENAKEREP